MTQQVPIPILQAILEVVSQSKNISEFFEIF